MLGHCLSVDVFGAVTEILPGWVFNSPAESFRAWVLDAIQRLQRNRDERFSRDHSILYWRRRRPPSGEAQEVWSGEIPEFRDSSTRIVASFEGMSLLCLKGLALQPISTPGFVGVIDLDSAVPDVSRRQALHADVGSILERASVGTRPQIVKHLDSLAVKGLLIDKLEFLDDCVAVYGRELLRESSVPWLSILRLPGAVDLVNSKSMLSLLSRSKSLFVAFGTGPWSAMRRWVAGDTEIPLEELAVVLDDIGRFRPGYSSGDEVKTGTLVGLWPTCSRSALFGTLLALVAEAWQVSLPGLLEQAGWQHHGMTIWGRMVRS